MVAPIKDRMRPVGLTNRERKSREQSVREILDGLRTHDLDKERAITGLEHCAVLIKDDSLPEDIGYNSFADLLKVALGRSVNSVKANTTVRVGATATEDASVEVSIIYGVKLHLSHSMQLVAISVTPHKVRGRNKRLGILGLASDVNSDVARNHDAYLAEVSPHAPS